MRRSTARWMHLGAAGALVVAGTLAACGRSQSGGYAPPPPRVGVVEITPRTLAVPYEFAGRVEGSREVEVRARVSGILLERAYREGSAVRVGQLLFRIDPAEYEARVAAARARLAEATARAARAEREAKRLEPLLEERATSQRSFDDAVSESEQANAAVLSARAQLESAELDLSYTRVTAPLSGLTSRAEKSEGALIEPGDEGLLTRIVRVQPIWVRFSVSDRALLALRKEVAAKRVVSPRTDALEVELTLADGSVHPERGRVNFSDPMIDPATGTVDLRAELPNAGEELLPGQFVRVRLLGIERPDAIVLPQRAVQQGQQGRFVYVIGADGTAEARPIEAGEWSGGDWIIASGLAAGERVIVDGAVKVRPGGAVEVVAAEGDGAASAESD